jgi:dihydroorotase-like cyclic amidohydrolase
LTADDEAELGAYGKMKPSLKSKADQKFLWDHLDAIDVFESDHAPHTRKEKASDPPPFGVPGLETTLPLFLTAEQEDKITRQQLLDRLHYAPVKIFNLQTDETTQVDVSLEEYEIKNEDLKTKAGWSPFAGRRAVGKVVETRLRGQTVYKNGEILAKSGTGRVIN